MTTVIQIDDLWKEYRLGVIGHGTLTKDLQSWWARLCGTEDPNSKIPVLKGQEKQIEGDRFWALRGINLEVEQGEILGIIGRNGAGKSTLLKILSRVTAPTQGTIGIKGRIASLLEVGTGFHPELTGRENIYLNGAILGMSKREINDKLDEIVDFSGIADFIDTPVKRYSSGMYVRLAFAVAAHLDPEIMIVDEVLAVGDADFKKKCLGKMGQIASQGRTVLFVSHQMDSIRSLCTSCAIVENGLVQQKGEDVERIVGDYLGESAGNLESKALWENRDDGLYHPNCKLMKFYLSDSAGNVLSTTISRYDDIHINIEFWVEQVDPSMIVGYDLMLKDECIYTSGMRDEQESSWPPVAIGLNKIRSRIPGQFLNEGTYHFIPWGTLYKREWILKPHIQDIVIKLAIKGEMSKSPYWTGKRKGMIAPVNHWETV